MPFMLPFWPSVSLGADCFPNCNIPSWLPGSNRPPASKQQLCSVLLKGSLTQTVTLQRSAVSCSRKSTPRLVAHAGTVEQPVFVPIPFPPFWLILTGCKCSARPAQEAGALELSLRAGRCSRSYRLSSLEIILAGPGMVLVTEDQRYSENASLRASALTKDLLSSRHCCRASFAFLLYVDLFTTFSERERNKDRGQKDRHPFRVFGPPSKASFSQPGSWADTCVPHIHREVSGHEPIALPCGPGCVTLHHRLAPPVLPYTSSRLL